MLSQNIEIFCTFAKNGKGIIHKCKTLIFCDQQTLSVKQYVNTGVGVWSNPFAFLQTVFNMVLPSCEQSFGGLKNNQVKKKPRSQEGSATGQYICLLIFLTAILPVSAPAVNCQVQWVNGLRR
jgi:hypothetical protein